MDILVTKRLTLRPPLEVDIDDIAEFIGNKNVSRMLARVPYPYFRKDAEWWIEHVSRNIDAGLDMAFTIHRERLIGAITVEGFDGVPKLGYWLAEPYWGKGFATEAAAAVLSHAFKTRDVERIASGVFTDNHGSLNVQKKLGFKLMVSLVAPNTQIGSTLVDIFGVIHGILFRAAFFKRYPSIGDRRRRQQSDVGSLLVCVDGVLTFRYPIAALNKEHPMFQQLAPVFVTRDGFDLRWK